MVEIRYVPELPLGLFGCIHLPTNTIFVADWLPESVQAFIVKHEVKHTTQIYRNEFLREIDANLYALWYYPIGGLRVLWMSLTSWRRLKLYWLRFRGQIDYEQIYRGLTWKVE